MNLTNCIVFRSPGEDGPIVCSSIRTQRRNCWDGEGIRIADFPVFQGDEIDEQGEFKIIHTRL